MVLLVIDTQKLITNEKLYCFETFVTNVKKLIASARANHVQVIYVRHDDGVGKELTIGADGYDIYKDFEPLNGEKIYDKRVNSAFKETGLLEYLTAAGETEIIITGLQTDYCIDANVKCGYEHGFHVIVPEKANTTVDNRYMTAEESYHYYNDFMWKDRYAECISVDKVVERMRHSLCRYRKD